MNRMKNKKKLNTTLDLEAIKSKKDVNFKIRWK